MEHLLHFFVIEVNMTVPLTFISHDFKASVSNLTCQRRVSGGGGKRVNKRKSSIFSVLHIVLTDKKAYLDKDTNKEAITHTHTQCSHQEGDVGGACQGCLQKENGNANLFKSHCRYVALRDHFRATSQQENVHAGLFELILSHVCNIQIQMLKFKETFYSVIQM